MLWGWDAALQEDLNLLGCPDPHPWSVPEPMGITVVGKHNGSLSWEGRSLPSPPLPSPSLPPPSQSEMV